MASQNVAINGPAIRQIRKLLGARTDVVAAEIGVSYSYLANMENGHRSCISPELFRKLAYTLRLDDVRCIMAYPHPIEESIEIPELEPVSC